MSSRRVLLVILAASFALLAVDIDYQMAGSARALAPSPEQALSGTTIPYPGRLADEAGLPVADAPYDFSFALYQTQTGGDPLWSENQEGIVTRDGAFVASLGSVNPVPASILDGADRWLAVSVRGPGEAEFTPLAPRQRLSGAAPAAANSPSNGAACPHDHFGAQWIGTGSDGLLVTTDAYVALEGWSDSYIGVAGISTPYSPVWPSGRAYGVYGYSYGDHGVYGRTFGDYGWLSGVYGEAGKDHAHGVTGWNTGGGPGVFGHSETGYAGYFDGPVYTPSYVNSAAGGSKIDHPLDPEGRYLYHSTVESPDMKNIYDGVAVLDADGAAWVDLPEWFGALNKDYRYQLTPIGAPAPQLFIAQEIEDNRFRIAGGDPGLTVSWQVTGIRQDAYARANPIPVEEDKPPEEQGTYLHPVEHGMPETLGVDYVRNRAWEPSEAGGE